MLIYAWLNRRYRPIRAKNLTWTTLIYASTVLWYIGNIACNGHVRLVGGWAHCKLWILWFRILFCFVFASMTIVRFYALDRVFNQKKPFAAKGNITAFVLVVFVNVTYCLVNQLISNSLTTEYIPSLEACNVTQALRIAAVTFQWVLWSSCGVLIYRLRNIQSSFNEFYESLAIFAVIIGLLIESSVTNLYYKYYILEQNRRIQKTVVDAVSSNLVVWLIIAYPVAMCIFRHKKYEQQWLERLADDSSRMIYAKVNEQTNSLLENKLNLQSTDSGNRIALEPFSLGISTASQNPLNVHHAIISSSLFVPDDYPTTPGGRHVL
ncbi:hypothetical protein IWW50_004785 [Coemansia erecta]|nr:hypothetical protein GGF43_002146 [Coemansia sp. RSA 2618]KAJ2821091.1 hypothetical protein IWW50_004785 [Coemansia erecta]